MRENPLPADIEQIFDRLSEVEKSQREASKTASDTNLEVQKELVRLDSGLRGVREQAKAHYEANIKAQAGIREQMESDKRSLESMITSNVRELYDGIDKIVSALGIDESAGAANNLRNNLQTLADMLTSRKQDILWIRRGVITLSISAIGTLLVLGAKTFLGG